MPSAVPTGASTSTPAPASKPLPAPTAPARAPQKLLVRRVAPTHVATRLTKRTHVQLADGSETHANEGDWLITAGQHTLSVIPAARFPGAYEIVPEGALTLSKAERERLEQTIGLGATRTASECLTAVERLARLHIGGVQIDFTPGQWAELQTRAAKRGQTLAQAVQAVVDRIRDEIFYKG